MTSSRSARLLRMVDHAARVPPRKPASERTSRPTRWSWRLGTIAGIPVQVHATFLLLLIWVALTPMLRGDAGAAMTSILLVLSIFACVVLHELGHALMARRFGVRTTDITLLPIGGVARLERMPEKPSQELAVALAGPAVSVAIAAALFGVLTLAGASTSPRQLQMTGGPFLTQLMWINLVLVGFNLLPAFPMDGGRVLRAALAMQMDRRRATEIAARVGQGMAVLFAIAGLFGNLFLVIIAAFIWIGATGEVSLVQLKSALTGLSVSQAMITDFRVVGPRDSLARAAELTLAGFQRDFPVMEGDRLAGMLTHADVVRGLAETGATTPVEAVMRGTCETTSPSAQLDVALAQLQSCEGRALAVVRDGQVVGLLTTDNIGEMLAMKQAVRTSHAT